MLAFDVCRFLVHQQLFMLLPAFLDLDSSDADCIPHFSDLVHLLSRS